MQKPLIDRWEGWKRCTDQTRRLVILGILLSPLLLAAACSSLLPASPPPANYYSLDYDAHGKSVSPGPGPVVVVSPPRATAGFDQARMVYVKQLHQIEYFAQNQWVESPSRMIGPLLVSALEHNGAFRAVLQTPSAAQGQMRVDSEIVRLQQEFLRSPSQVRFTLRVRLINDDTRAVIASREFEAVVDAPSDNPYGGVQASNQAVGKVLDDAAAFCAQNVPALTTAAGK